ncbi:MAG: T9SS type A sorting domain-containing protein [Candidatus Latescibacterota bacterium]
MRKAALLLPAALLVLSLGVDPAAARPARTFRARTAKIAQDITFGDKGLINVNNMAMWFKRDGYSAGNPYTDNSGVTYPRSTDQVIYRDGLVWGGKVMDGNPQILRVGGGTYSIGTVPGRIISQGVADNATSPRVRIYRVRRDWRTADLRLETSEYLDKGLSEVTDAEVAAVRAQYEKDWREWPAEWGAPYYDNNGDGRYDPSADEPGVASADQVAWFVVNDLDVGATQALYGALPIGIECQVLMWGYARTDALGDAIFKKYTVIYKGTGETPADAHIDSMYFAQWSDPDLGDYSDDYAGCDTELSLGYVYNSTDHDSHYDAFDLAPPAAGYDFLQGPIVPVYTTDEEGNQITDETAEAIFGFQKRTGYRNLPMTAFVYFAAGSSIDDPELTEYIGTLEWYNLLRGFEPQPDVDNPTPYSDPLTGEETKFTLSGDPTRATGWNDGTPLPAGDRRIVLATGPFQMALGDTQEVVVALLGGIGSDRLRSVSKLKFNDQFVQDAYNTLFQVPKPPAAPKVKVAQLDKAIVLDWGWDAAAVAQTEAASEAGFEFEGYNVYQLPSAESPRTQARKVATYDVENAVATILGINLDEQSGVILDVPLQVGSDSGVRRYLKVTQDAVNGGPLVNGQEYYFAVTAYNRNPAEGAAVTTLESPLQVQIVVPQMPPPGSRYEADPEEVLESTHARGTSDGAAVATVIDPTMTTGDSYKVTFGERDVTDEEGTVVGQETVWNLLNTTKGTTLISANPDQSGAAYYVGAEGFQIAVSGPPNGMKGYSYTPGGNRWLTWWGPGGATDNWGAEGYGGSITGDVSNQWFTSSTVPPAGLRTVELRFTAVHEEDGEDQYKPLDLQNENVSYAYRYMRRAVDPAPAPGDLTTTSNPYDWSQYIVNPSGGYAFQDRSPVCLSAWDVDSNKPRRLEVGFLENNVPGGLVNGAWGPAFYNTASNVGGGGPREWLFIWDLPYTDSPAGGSELLRTSDPSGTPTPLMWIVFSSRRREATVPASGSDPEVPAFPRNGDVFRLIANYVNTAADEFTFTVPGTTTSRDLALQDAKLINVFPNPYYGVNEAETSPYDHFVTFSHLPQKATIRIYDLAGTLVRKLEKDSPDQFLRWDLTNHNELPVASGLYVAHVELPALGRSRILKLAIVQEQQFLQNF